MAYSLKTYTGDDSTTSFSAVFPVIETGDITVKVDDIELVETVDFNFTNFNSFGQVATINFITAPALDAAISFQRFTTIIDLETVFSNTSELNDFEMNKVNLQLLYSIQEADDRINNYINRVGGNNIMDQDLNMNDYRIINLGTALLENDAIGLKQATDLFESVTGGGAIENPFAGSGYEIGQTALSAADLTTSLDFTFKSRAITAQYEIVLYPDFNAATAPYPGADTVYDIGGGFFELPALSSADANQEYYTRLR